jgi:RHS repeat-associated protein
VSAWPYLDDGGYIGLFNDNASSGYFDDFGGGTLAVSYQPGSNKVLAAYHPAPAVRVKAATSFHSLLKRLPAVQAISLLNLVRGTGVVWRSYYYAGTARIAMREVSDEGTEVYYLLTDHLGSTSTVVYYDEYDVMHVKAQQKYKPWGEVRQVTGELPTDYTYTGQRSTSWGLQFYRARWYDSNLGRFAESDTIIPNPGDPAAWDRFAYGRNNPVRYTDPSGHYATCDDRKCTEAAPIFHFKVSFVGFNALLGSEKVKVYSALQAIAAKLGGVNRFNSVFGGTIFKRDTNLGSFGGQWNKDGTIHLNPKLMDKYVIVHEFGHVLQSLVYEIDYDNSPANQLTKKANAIKDDRGLVVSGVDDGNYSRTDLGYQSCPYGKACRFEEHPTSIDKNAEPPVNPNNPGEDVADMFMNWVYDSFDYGSEAYGAGFARYEWWNSRMPSWLDTIR